MKIDKTSSQTSDQDSNLVSNQKLNQVKGLGLCSGGLDSILSALLLKQQDISVTWICFETPFFSAEAAKKASEQTGIPLIVCDITDEYMEMMKAPKAGFGKNMNPCMDCHALMFEKAGQMLEIDGFDFLFSGEVLGQRPKSQNRNSLRYVEKNSRYDGHIVRPLCAKLLPQTSVERQGLVDREKLMDISGRSRKVQMEMAKEYGIKEYPSPAGGCLLTDILFSNRLRDLMQIQVNFQTRELFYLRFGRHFRLDPKTKIMVGRSKKDNESLMHHFDKTEDVLLKHANLPGPDVILTGNATDENINLAANICASYTKATPGENTDINLYMPGVEKTIQVSVKKSDRFKDLMIKGSAQKLV